MKFYFVFKDGEECIDMSGAKTPTQKEIEEIKTLVPDGIEKFGDRHYACTRAIMKTVRVTEDRREMVGAPNVFYIRFKENNAYVFKEGVFEIGEEFPYIYRGYGNNTPRFELHEALRVMRDFNDTCSKIYDQMFFAATEDAFIMNGGYEWKGQDYETEHGTKHLYAVYDIGMWRKL